MMGQFLLLKKDSDLFEDWFEELLPGFTTKIIAHSAYITLNAWCDKYL
jgi:hypothetical protein